MKRLVKFATNHSLIIIVVLAFLLRILGIVNITLAGDFAYHWSVAENIIINHQLPLLGPTASIQDSFHLGPFYYYFLAVIHLLSAGNYHIAIIWFSLINALSIFLLYKMARIWLQHKDALIVCLLYATSYYTTSIGNFPWNPYLLPPFLFASVIVFHKIRGGKKAYLPILFLLLALMLQLHGSVVFLLPVFIGPLLFQKIQVKYWLVAFSVAVIPFLPWLYAESQCFFCQTQKMTMTLFSATEETCSFTDWLKNHGNGERCFGYLRNSLFVLRMFSQSLLGQTKYVLLPLMAILIWFWVYKVRWRNNGFLVSWLIIPWLFFLLYDGNVYLHYFLIFLPLPFIFLVTTVSFLQKKYPKSSQLLTLFLVSICLWNIVLFLNSLQTIRG